MNTVVMFCRRALVRLLLRWQWILGFNNGREVSWLAERLRASQEGILCGVGLRKENKFEMACKYMECGNMDWTHLTHRLSIHGLDSSDPQSFHSLAVVKTVMNIGIPQKLGVCWTEERSTACIKLSLLTKSYKVNLCVICWLHFDLVLVLISHWNRNWRI